MLQVTMQWDTLCMGGISKQTENNDINNYSREQQDIRTMANERAIQIQMAIGFPERERE